MDNYNQELTDIEINVDDILYGSEEDRWKELLDEIMAGNVIPVIGPDFQVTSNVNFHQQLINIFAKMFKISSDPQTFSQLIYDKNFPSHIEKPEAIYKLINQAIPQLITRPSLRPSNLLFRLLNTKKFPFVITTSFTPVVENVMEQVWGEGGVEVRQFCNDPSRDLKPGIGDVLSAKQIRKPTVFYMFGKYSAEKNRYVVTDVDMMEFCKSWLSDSKTPRILTEAIKAKYLLVLGNNFSDWLFRFVCYSLRSSAQDLRSSLLVNTHVDEDNPLIQFLNRLETFIQRDPEVVVSEIERRIKIRENDAKNKKSKSIEDKYDVFLSYSRSDEAIVKRLHEALADRELRVWYDRYDIGDGNNWEKEINIGIRDSRIFVPILTSNIEREIMDEHVYRTEWNIASERVKARGDVTFIVPLAERGFNFQKKETDIPAKFSERNAIMFNSDDDMNSIADRIKIKVNEVKKLEEEYCNG